MSFILWLAACADAPPVLVAVDGVPHPPADDLLTFTGEPGEVKTIRFTAEDPDGDDVWFWWAAAPPGWDQPALGGARVEWTVAPGIDGERGALILEGRGPSGSLHTVYDAWFDLAEDNVAPE